MEECDVGIVGAGPAGASAALALEGLGVRYVLIERCALPRPKPCAGVLPPGIEEALGPLPRRAYERRVQGYYLHTESGLTFLSRFDRPGYTVDRRRFDEWLLSRLRERPVRAELLGVTQAAARVHARTSAGELVCKVLIGADGSGSRVRSSVGIGRGPVALACQTAIPMPPAEVNRRTGAWFHIFYVVPGGYGWVAPHRSSLRVGVGSLRPGRSGPRGLMDFLKRREVARLTGGLEGGGPEAPGASLGGDSGGPGSPLARALEAHTIPMGGPLPKVARGRVLLAGDAGGFVFPGTGEGIRFALASGAAAARAAALWLRRDARPRELEREYLRALEAEGLLSLRSVDFSRALRTPERAERYVRGLRAISGGAGWRTPRPPEFRPA
ncbi:MAG: FAD-dependent monooxygenase [Thermoplasmatota archaeon]